MAPRGRASNSARLEKKVEDEDVEMISDTYDSDSGSPSRGKGDIERWRASESPRESFSDAEGANEDGEWRYQIIGEEVRHDGTIAFEVMWEDWRRADGTRTTWHRQDDCNIDTKRWSSAQKRLRRKEANKSMEVKIMTTTDIHNTATFLRSEAFEEKLRKAQTEPQPNWVDETAKLMAKHQAHVHPSPIPTQGSSSSSFLGRTSQRATTRQQTEASYSSLSSATARGSSISGRSSITLGAITAPTPTPSVPHKSTPPMSLKAQGKQREILADDPMTGVLHSQSSLVTSVKGQGKQPERNPPSLATGSLSSSRRSSMDHSETGKTCSRCGTSSTPLWRRDPSTMKLLCNACGIRLQPRNKPRHPSPTDPPFVLLSPHKRVKRVISESEDELSYSEPPKIGPPRKKAPKSRGNEGGSLRDQPKGIAARNKLQQDWSRIAKRDSAVHVSFVNDVDDEAIPQLDPAFRYLERSYEYAPGIDPPDPGFLLTCSCRACDEPTGCECQQSSEFVDEMGRPIHAYTQNGLFAFNIPKNLEVVECNQGCSCSLSTCKNRVSQRARDVPIEIFKTQNRGWGARASVSVKRGKVLGIYTGRVLRRADSRELRSPFNAYTFDLDGDEQEDIQITHEEYTVDSRCQGNWTRFINHSCTPNLQIYLVVHDTPINTGMPYIAFVATEDIPARTEFTFDYNPAAAAAEAATGSKGKKGKAQLQRPEGAESCFCGSSRCRRFI